DKRLLLRHFLYCGSKEKASSLSLKNILKYAQHNIYYGARIPLYERRGDVLPASEGGYLGFPLKHQFRYTLSYGNNFRLGIVGANDAGEEFFAHKNALGYDYYSFFMQLKERRLSKTLMLDNLVIGKYIGGFGMGLVVNNGFSLGKSTMMASAGRISTGFRPHASTTDGNYFQGLATTIGNVSKPNHAKHKASVFASYRFINANRSGDSITTILTSGYHRTENELLKKNTATATTLGANYQFGIKRIAVGATAAYTHLNRTLMPDKRQAFRLYYPEGKNFFNAGLNYSYMGKRFSFRGETAIAPAKQANDSLQGTALATINSICFRPSYSFNATLLHRYFSTQYAALNARTFSESTSIQDENGVFVSLLWRCNYEITLNYYTDFAHFARPKYLVSRPSNIVENVLLATWHKQKWTATLRARLKNREYDNEAKTALVWKNNFSLRLQGEYNANGSNFTTTKKEQLDLHGKLLLQYSHYDKAAKTSNGFLAMLSGGLQPLHWLSLDIATGYFNTDDY
ncbi:MAG: hypothetical protein HUK07_07580, partial [Bacteroidaceae bacterium]|nr:hypothetical protein [Bacteroidaceae bacterium]